MAESSDDDALFGSEDQASGPAAAGALDDAAAASKELAAASAPVDAGAGLFDESDDEGGAPGSKDEAVDDDEFAVGDFEITTSASTRRTRNVNSARARADLLRLPKLPRPDASHRLTSVRLPNILALEERCFDEATFDEAEDVARAIHKGKDLASENIIRWRRRAGANGSGAALESNTRIVQWSDGSYQLWIGDESFDISMQNLNGAGEGSALFAVVKDVREESELQPSTHVHFAAHGLIESKMLLRPSVLNSQVHKELTAAANIGHAKRSKIRRAPAKMEDPEKAKMDRLAMRQKEARNARLASQRNARQSGRGYGKRASSGASGLSEAFLNADDDEEEEFLDDEQTMSIAMVRKASKRRGGANKREREQDRADDRGFIVDGDGDGAEEEEEEEEAVSTSADDEDDEDGAAGDDSAVTAALPPSASSAPTKKKRRRVIGAESDSD
jgi:hypothetical protein